MSTGDPKLERAYYEYTSSTPGKWEVKANQWNWGFMATAAIYPSTYIYPPLQTEERRDMMTLFKIYVVDAKELVLLSSAESIAENREDAIAALELEPEVRRMIRQKRARIITEEVGSFERYRKKDD